MLHMHMLIVVCVLMYFTCQYGCIPEPADPGDRFGGVGQLRVCVDSSSVFACAETKDR